MTQTAILGVPETHAIAKAQAKAGTLGTLALALECIADNARPVLVIVRVADGEGETDEAREDDQTSKVVGDYVGGERTGIQALLEAEQNLGVKPRILVLEVKGSIPVLCLIFAFCLIIFKLFFFLF